MFFTTQPNYAAVQPDCRLTKTSPTLYQVFHKETAVMLHSTRRLCVIRANTPFCPSSLQVELPRRRFLGRIQQQHLQRKLLSRNPFHLIHHPFPQPMPPIVRMHHQLPNLALESVCLLWHPRQLHRSNNLVTARRRRYEQRGCSVRSCHRGRELEPVTVCRVVGERRQESKGRSVGLIVDAVLKKVPERGQMLLHSRNICHGGQDERRLVLATHLGALSLTEQ